MMSRDRARVVSNLVLASAAGALVYYVLRTPSLRALAWRATRTAVTSALPALLAREVTEAWQASGRAA